MYLRSQIVGRGCQEEGITWIKSWKRGLTSEADLIFWLELEEGLSQSMTNNEEKRAF